MKFKNGLLALFAIVALSACKDSDKADDMGGAQNPTYVNISVKLPTSIASKAAGDDNTINRDSTYAGNDIIKNLDIYIESANGDIDRMFFEGSDITINTAGENVIVSPSLPFRTTPGEKIVYVVLNDVNRIGQDMGHGTQNDLVDIDGLASIEDDKDLILMSGTASMYIAPSITAQDVITSSINRIPVEVLRVASRVIVTHTLDDMSFDDGSGHTGTLSKITYSVAQGAKKVYWLAPTGANIYNSYGYDYVPRINAAGDIPYTGDDYAKKYYDYSDLSTPSVVEVKPPAADEYRTMKGKFLFENTHKKGFTEDDTSYRKGNTAYVLVSVTFTPDAASIFDEVPLTDGTFYMGLSTNRIYGSKQNALDGLANQKVRTYLNGKMYFFAWLNPDDVQKPLNSPVLRNNIYHINIKSFSKLGETWNPLYPEDPDTTLPDNPNPKPHPDEPGSLIDPYDPLSVEETYMNVDVEVLEWTVNSYDIDF